MTGNTLRSIETPMGRIVCELHDDSDYPALCVYLHTPDGHSVLLAMVEYEVEDQTIGICSYFDMLQDDPVYHDRINAEDVENYLREVG